MGASFEKMGNNDVKITIEVDTDTFAGALNTAYRKMVGRMSVPGFRKGKAPRKIIENYYGESVFYEEAVNHVLADAYKTALEETEILPVSQADFDIVQIGKDKPLIVTATVEVKPEIELAEYKGLEVPKAKVEVAEADVDARIEQERDNTARWVDVDRPAQMGDQVLFDFSGSVDGVKFEGGTATNHSLELGSGMFIPGFEDQMVGMAKNEEKVITVTFPEQYHAEELAGKDAQFEIFLHEIKEKELAALDDEFAKDVSEFDTFDEYKADVRKKLTETAERNASVSEENAMLDKLAEGYAFQTPKALVEDRITDMLRDLQFRLMMQRMSLEQYLKYSGQSMQDLRDSRRAEAERGVKIDLVLEAIAKAEKIEYDKAEYDARVKEEAERNKKSVEEFMQTQLAYLERLEEALTAQKTIEFLRENTKWVEAE